MPPPQVALNEYQQEKRKQGMYTCCACLHLGAGSVAVLFLLLCCLCKVEPDLGYNIIIQFSYHSNSILWKSQVMHNTQQFFSVCDVEC